MVGALDLQQIGPSHSASRNDSGQVFHTHVPLFTNQYKLVQPKGNDALRLGR